MIFRTTILGVAFALAAANCNAQTYPSKPVRFVLTNPPGGTVDTLARVLGDELGKSLGQPFVIENRPGANGTIGGEIVATAAPDGHTILLGPPGPIALNKLLYAKMPYDPGVVFAPVSLVAIAPLVLVATPALPATSLQQLLADARARPGQITYASQGNGSSGHLAMELLKSMTGVDLVHVPYKGSAPAIADLLASRVQVMFDNTTSSLPQVRSGKLRALAVAERTRLKAAPEIPTVDESGVKGFEATPWFGVVTRAGTPKETVDRLAAQIGEIVRRPDVEARFAALGVELKGTTPEAFAAHIERELAKWDRIVKQSGAKLD
jgi:tripartite-type tricarboxylate transporter receptor subunit TctC